MPGIAQPPGIPSIDPTPGPNDITSFEQAQALSTAPERSATPEPGGRSAPAASAPAAPAKEIQLSAPRDENKPDQFPQSVWDDLDKIAKPETKTEAKAEAPAAEATETTPATEPSTPDPTLEADLDKQANAFKTPKELRNAYKETLKRERALAAERESLTKRVTEFEAKLKNGDPEQVKALSTELETLRKDREALLSRVKALDFTQHPEFHDKYVQPLAKELGKAYAFVKELKLNDDATGTQRAATESDFKQLLGLPAQEAGELAEKLFGRYAATRVLNHRDRVIELKTAENEARAEASKLADESQQRASVENTQAHQKRMAVYQSRRTEIETKHADLFKAKENDTEALKVLESGRQLAQLLEDESIDDESRTKIATDLRMRGEAFGHVVLQRNRAQAQLAEALKKLAAYEKSAPRDGDAPTQLPGDAPVDPMEKSLRGLERIARPV
jgi:hypothetical protein